MIKHALRQAQAQLGWQGRYGIALLSLAAAFHWLALKPLEDETSLMHSRIEAVRPKVDIQGRNSSPRDRQEELGLFFESLPQEKDITDTLAAIYSTAEVCGLQFKQAAYRLEESAKPRVEYVVEFPVSGEYPKIRLFVFRLLAKHPAVALDRIDFQRDRVVDANLKANVRLTLFLMPFR